MDKIAMAAGVIFLAKDTGRCLLQLRASTGKRFSNTWGFWGGMMKEKETAHQCIIRELKEEIGFVPNLETLTPIDTYKSPDNRFLYFSFVYVVDGEFMPSLNRESAGYAWVTIGQWPKPLHAGSRATLMRNGGTDKLHTIYEIYSTDLTTSL